MESLRALQLLSLRRLLTSRSVASGQTQSSIRHVSKPSLRPQPLLSRAQPSRPFTSFRHAFRPKYQSPRLNRPPRRLQSTQPSPPPSEPPESSLSLSQRFKKLSREYGWSAVGVYLLLSALDLPICFLAVRLVGVDKIGHYEHVVMSYVKGLVKWPVSGVLEPAPVAPVEIEAQAGTRILEEDSESYAVEDHGYEEAEKANRGDNASLWTQLALAYVIHKSFIFVRIPLTAAVTPKVVKTLRGWGWNIGKMPSRKKVGSTTTTSTTGSSGVNTKGTGVKPE